MSTTLPLTEAKARLNELVESAVLTHERVTITRHGKPAAVLMAVEDLESLLETLHWQAEPGVGSDINRSEAEASAGELWGEDSVRARYDADTA